MMKNEKKKKKIKKKKRRKETKYKRIKGKFNSFLLVVGRTLL